MAQAAAAFAGSGIANDLEDGTADDEGDTRELAENAKFRCGICRECWLDRVSVAPV